MAFIGVHLRDETDRGTLGDVEAGYHLPPAGFNPKTILDLGSHAGFTIIDFLKKYRGAYVWGVEMDLNNFLAGEQNIANNGLLKYVTLYNYAITDWNGKCGYTAGASNAHEVNAIDGDTDCLTLDTLMAMIKWPIDFAKFDIEGQERAVFKQGGHWPDRIESLKAELHGNYSIEESRADLEALGYLTLPGELHPNSVFAWKE